MALRDSGLKPARLQLEITKSVMLQDTEEVLRTLQELRALGVGIALDDFGTGYSSLSYLRRFPFTKVKIDRSFIGELGTNADADAIVAAVTDLCDTLGMTVLAEDGQGRPAAPAAFGKLQRGPGLSFQPPATGWRDRGTLPSTDAGQLGGCRIQPPGGRFGSAKRLTVQCRLSEASNNGMCRNALSPHL